MLTVLLLVLHASPELEAGRADSAAMKYARAAEELRVAAQDAGAPLSERVEALDLLARARLALGDQAGAKAAYLDLLKLAPMTGEPKGSPKVRSAFAAAKQAAFPPTYLKLQRQSSGPDVLEVEVLNPWSLEVRVELWSAGAGKPRELPVKASRVLTALEPGTHVWLRAVALDGVLLASLGSPEAAIDGPPAPPAPPVVAAADAPKAMLPALAPAQPGPSLASAQEQKPKAQPWSPLRKAGLGVLLGGAALTISGVPVTLWASSEKQLAEGWPLNGTSFDEMQAHTANSQSLTRVGGGLILGGLLVAAVGGLLMLLGGP